MTKLTDLKGQFICELSLSEDRVKILVDPNTTEEITLKYRNDTNYHEDKQSPRILQRTTLELVEGDIFRASRFSEIVDVSQTVEPAEPPEDCDEWLALMLYDGGSTYRVTTSLLFRDTEGAYGHLKITWFSCAADPSITPSPDIESSYRRRYTY